LRRRLWPFPTEGPGVFHQLLEGHQIPSVSGQSEGFRPFGKYHGEQILFIVIQQIAEQLFGQFSPELIFVCGCMFTKIQCAQRKVICPAGEGNRTDVALTQSRCLTSWPYRQTVT
jgi:hypothetical protein